jgi:O-antigen/teichoic acid export membrane protein
MAQRGTEGFSFMHLFKGSALYGSSDIVVALVRFSLIALYTRIMSPAEFGLFSIIMTSLTLAMVFVPLGLPSALMLRLNDSSTPQEKVLKDGSFFFLLQVCLVGGAVFYALSYFAFPKTLILDLAPWLIVYATAEITGMVPKVSLRLKEKIAAFSVAKIVRIIVMVFFLVALLRLHVAGIKAIILAEAVSALIECLLCMALDEYWPTRPSFSGAASLLGIGVPLAIVSFGFFCIDLSDRYVVYLIMGQQASGYYAAAAKVAIAASFFVEAFNNMWFPYYLRMMSGKGTTVPESLKGFASRLIVLFSMVISLFMLILPLFVRLHIGGKYFIAPQYHSVATLVAPLTLAYFFKAVFYISSGILIAHGKTWALVRIVYSAAIVNVAANVLWASLFHGDNQFAALTAIALMTSVSYGLCMVWAAYACGLFRLRYWIASRDTIFCAVALCLPFAPGPAIARFAALGFVFAAALWMYMKDKETGKAYL